MLYTLHYLLSTVDYINNIKIKYNINNYYNILYIY